MLMEPDMNDTTWKSSPLSAIREPVTAPDTLSEGPVKFLLVSGQLDDGRWGLVGAYWLSIDGARGGFLVAPPAIWSGSELVRSFRSGRRTRVERRAHLRVLAGPGRHGGAVHDRPAAARRHAVPGRPPRRRPLSGPQALRRSSHSSQVTSTSRAFEPWLGPTTPCSSSRSMMRPARANPTFSLRWSMEVEPSWERITSSAAWLSRSSSLSPGAARPAESSASVGGMPSPSTCCS